MGAGRCTMRRWAVGPLQPRRGSEGPRLPPLRRSSEWAMMRNHVMASPTAGGAAHPLSLPSPVGLARPLASPSSYLACPALLAPPPLSLLSLRPSLPATTRRCLAVRASCPGGRRVWSRAFRARPRHGIGPPPLSSLRLALTMAGRSAAGQRAPTASATGGSRLSRMGARAGSSFLPPTSPSADCARFMRPVPSCASGCTWLIFPPALGDGPS